MLAHAELKASFSCSLRWSRSISTADAGRTTVRRPCFVLGDLDLSLAFDSSSDRSTLSDAIKINVRPSKR